MSDVDDLTLFIISPASYGRTNLKLVQELFRQIAESGVGTVLEFKGMIFLGIHRGDVGLIELKHSVSIPTLRSEPLPPKYAKVSSSY